MDNNNPNLNIKDLIPGEIYLYYYRFIARYPTGPSLDIRNESFVTHEKWVWSLNIQEVTPEQRDWYAACVKANKFIPKEEALKKTKFEVGKWYKLEIYNAICKFQRLKNNNFYHTGEVIWLKGLDYGYHKNYGAYFSNINQKIIEVPLEEIQQYLPEGHPDKIKTKPKMYTDEELLEYANKHFVIGTKFISSISDKGRVRECIFYDANQETFGWKIIYYNGERRVFCNNGMYTRDILNNYVCGNPNIYSESTGWVKITYDASESEFKLSDKWYVIVTNNNQFNLILNYLIKKGYLNKHHTNYTPYKYPFRIGKESKKEGYYDNSIEIGQKITFEQFKKYILKKDNYNHFKIGDIVEYIGTETNLSNDTKKDDLQLGYNYIVKSISKNNIELHGKLFYHDMNLFKLATNKEFPLIDHPDWKIGDRVEIIDKGKNYIVYSEAFKKLNFKNKEQNRCDNGYKGKIFHVCFHPTQNDILIAINLNNGGQCLIGYKGIKKIDTSSNKVIEIVDDVPTFKSKEKHTTKPIQTQKLKAILIK